MGSNRIKGNKLMFTVDGVDVWADATKVELLNEEADAGVTTFEDAANGGGRSWYFDLSGVQSTVADSLWAWLWDNTGNEVPYVYAPHGNPMPTLEHPHFTGTLRVGPKPKVGGEASANGDFTFDARLDCTAEPELVRAGIM